MPDGIDRWAAYLWQVAVQIVVNDPLLLQIAHIIMGIMALGVGVFILCIFASLKSKPARQQEKRDKLNERKHPSTSGFERLLQWLSPPSDPWVVGNIVVDFTWLAHCLVWGTTGSGKSSFSYYRIIRPYLGLPGLLLSIARLFAPSLVPIRQRRGCLIFAGNMSKPFRAAVLWLMEHGYPCLIWEPDPLPGQGFGLDVLEGPPDNVGQRLIKMQPVATGDTGLRSGAVEGMLVDTIYTLDRAGKPRTFENILITIRNVGIRDLDEQGNPVGEARPMTNQERTGLENWCTRFATLRRRLGACIGSDVKLSEALAAGYVIFIQGSSYRNPNSVNELTNLIVYYVMWLVSYVGNFDFLIDEPGAVEKGTFTRLLTATRAQGVRIMICPQSLEQIDKTLREMCTTVLLLGTASGAPEAAELASELVHKDIEPVDFTLLKPTNWREKTAFWRKRRGLRSCSGYLLDNGRLDYVKVEPFGCKNCGQKDRSGRKLSHKRGCKLAIIDRWPMGSIPKLPAQDSPVVSNSVLPETASPTKPNESEDSEDEPRVEQVPEWARVDEQAANVYGYVEQVGGHRLSKYARNNRGRPIAKYKGKPWLTYALMLALYEKRDLDEVAERMADLSTDGLTCDHLCRTLDPTCTKEDEQRCQEVSHLRWRLRGGHGRIEWKRRRRRLGAQKEIVGV